MSRSLFLQASLGAAQIGLAAGAGLLLPVAALATDWPVDALHAASFDHGPRPVPGSWSGAGLLRIDFSAQLLGRPFRNIEHGRL